VDVLEHENQGSKNYTKISRGKQIRGWSPIAWNCGDKEGFWRVVAGAQSKAALLEFKRYRGQMRET
jgi:hypothetical protein